MGKKAKLPLHEKRGITFQELGALLGARAMLASGVITHSESCILLDNISDHVFNMSIPGMKNDHCGSIGCIGGTMAFIMGVDPLDYVGGRYTKGRNSPTLRDLFYPPEQARDASVAWADWDWITPKVAAAAIDNWLKTGEPNYKSLYRRRHSIERA